MQILKGFPIKLLNSLRTPEVGFQMKFVMELLAKFLNKLPVEFLEIFLVQLLQEFPVELPEEL